MEMQASVVSTEGKHQDGKQQGEHEGAEIGGSTTENEEECRTAGDVVETVLCGLRQHRSVARHSHREQKKQSRHMTAAARVTKGKRRKWRVENANNFLILFRTIVVGGDQLVLAASKAGSIALSKVGKVGWGWRWRFIREWGRRRVLVPL
jgi:hypothetical protein